MKPSSYFLRVVAATLLISVSFTSAIGYGDSSVILQSLKSNFSTVGVLPASNQPDGISNLASTLARGSANFKAPPLANDYSISSRPELRAPEIDSAWQETAGLIYAQLMQSASEVMNAEPSQSGWVYIESGAPTVFQFLADRSGTPYVHLHFKHNSKIASHGYVDYGFNIRIDRLSLDPNETALSDLMVELANPGFDNNGSRLHLPGLFVRLSDIKPNSGEEKQWQTFKQWLTDEVKKTINSRLASFHHALQGRPKYHLLPSGEVAQNGKRFYLMHFSQPYLFSKTAEHRGFHFKDFWSWKFRNVLGKGKRSKSVTNLSKDDFFNPAVSDKTIIEELIRARFNRWFTGSGANQLVLMDRTHRFVLKFIIPNVILSNDELKQLPFTGVIKFIFWIARTYFRSSFFIFLKQRIKSAIRLALKDNNVSSIPISNGYQAAQKYFPDHPIRHRILPAQKPSILKGAPLILQKLVPPTSPWVIQEHVPQDWFLIERLQEVLRKGRLYKAKQMIQKSVDYLASLFEKGIFDTDEGMQIGQNLAITDNDEYDLIDWEGVTDDPKRIENFLREKQAEVKQIDEQRRRFPEKSLRTVIRELTRERNGLAYNTIFHLEDYDFPEDEMEELSEFFLAQIREKLTVERWLQASQNRSQSPPRSTFSDQPSAVRAELRTVRSSSHSAVDQVMAVIRKLMDQNTAPHAIYFSLTEGEILEVLTYLLSPADSNKFWLRTHQGDPRERWKKVLPGDFSEKDFRELGIQLREEWGKRGLLAQFGNMNQYLATLIDPFIKDLDEFIRLAKRLDSLLLSGNLEDYFYAYWTLALTQVMHLRATGLHIEKFDGEDAKKPVDNELLVDYARRFIGAVFAWPDDKLNQIPPSSPKFKKDHPNFTYQNLMRWGLSVILDQDIHDWKHGYRSQVGEHIYTREYGPIFWPRGGKQSMSEYLSRILTKIPELGEDGAPTGRLIPHESIEKLVAAVLALNENDWIAMGFRSPWNLNKQRASAFIHPAGERTGKPLHDPVFILALSSLKHAGLDEDEESDISANSTTPVYQKYERLPRDFIYPVETAEIHGRKEAVRRRLFYGDPLRKLFPNLRVLVARERSELRVHEPAIQKLVELIEAELSRPVEIDETVQKILGLSGTESAEEIEQILAGETNIDPIFGHQWAPDPEFSYKIVELLESLNLTEAEKHSLVIKRLEEKNLKTSINLPDYMVSAGETRSAIQTSMSFETLWRFVDQLKIVGRLNYQLRDAVDKHIQDPELNRKAKSILRDIDWHDQTFEAKRNFMRAFLTRYVSEGMQSERYFKALLLLKNFFNQTKMVHKDDSLAITLEQERVDLFRTLEDVVQKENFPEEHEFYSMDRVAAGNVQISRPRFRDKNKISDRIEIINYILAGFLPSEVSLRIRAFEQLEGKIVQVAENAPAYKIEFSQNPLSLYQEQMFDSSKRQDVDADGHTRGLKLKNLEPQNWTLFLRDQKTGERVKGAYLLGTVEDDGAVILDYFDLTFLRSPGQRARDIFGLVLRRIKEELEKLPEVTTIRGETEGVDTVFTLAEFTLQYFQHVLKEPGGEKKELLMKLINQVEAQKDLKGRQVKFFERRQRLGYVIEALTEFLDYVSAHDTKFVTAFTKELPDTLWAKTRFSAGFVKPNWRVVHKENSLRALELSAEILPRRLELRNNSDSRSVIHAQQRPINLAPQNKAEFLRNVGRVRERFRAKLAESLLFETLDESESELAHLNHLLKELLRAYFVLGDDLVRRLLEEMNTSLFSYSRFKKLRKVFPKPEDWLVMPLFEFYDSDKLTLFRNYIAALTSHSPRVSALFFGLLGPHLRAEHVETDRVFDTDSYPLILEGFLPELKINLDKIENLKQTGAPRDLQLENETKRYAAALLNGLMFAPDHENILHTSDKFEFNLEKTFQVYRNEYFEIWQAELEGRKLPNLHEILKRSAKLFPDLLPNDEVPEFLKFWNPGQVMATDLVDWLSLRTASSAWDFVTGHAGWRTYAVRGLRSSQARLFANQFDLYLDQLYWFLITGNDQLPADFSIQPTASALRKSDRISPPGTSVPESQKVRAELREGSSIVKDQDEQVKDFFIRAYEKAKAGLGGPPDAVLLSRILEISEQEVVKISTATGLPLSRTFSKSATYTDLGLYLNHLMDRVPRDQYFAISKTIRELLVVNMAKYLAIQGLPASLGEENGKVIAHFERIHPDKRDLFVFLKPANAPETEPPHAMRRIIFNETGDFKVFREGHYVNQLHEIRQLLSLGYHYRQTITKLGRVIQPKELLAKLALFVRYARPIRWTWVKDLSVNTIEKKLQLEQGQLSGSSTTKLSIDQILNKFSLRRARKMGSERRKIHQDTPSLITPEYLKKNERILLRKLNFPKDKLEETVQSYSAQELQALFVYLLRFEKNSFLKYKTILNSADLFIIDSEILLKRALGILSYYGFLFSYDEKEDILSEGVRILDLPASRYLAGRAPERITVAGETVSEMVKSELRQTNSTLNYTASKSSSQVQIITPKSVYQALPLFLENQRAIVLRSFDLSKPSDVIDHLAKRIVQDMLFAIPNYIGRYLDPFVLGELSNPKSSRFEKLTNAISEAVTNAMIHGNQNRPGSEVVIRWQVGNFKLLIDVIDESKDPINFERKKRRLPVGVHSFWAGSPFHGSAWIKDFLPKDKLENWPDYDFPLSNDQGEREGQIVRLEVLLGSKINHQNQAKPELVQNHSLLIKELSAALQAHGFNDVVLTDGAVRDILFGSAVRDIDIQPKIKLNWGEARALKVIQAIGNLDFRSAKIFYLFLARYFVKQAGKRKLEVLRRLKASGIFDSARSFRKFNYKGIEVNVPQYVFVTDSGEVIKFKRSVSIEYAVQDVNGVVRYPDLETKMDYLQRKIRLRGPGPLTIREIFRAVRYKNQYPGFSFDPAFLIEAEKFIRQMKQKDMISYFQVYSPRVKKMNLDRLADILDRVGEREEEVLQDLQTLGILPFLTEADPAVLEFLQYRKSLRSELRIAATRQREFNLKDIEILIIMSDQRLTAVVRDHLKAMGASEDNITTARSVDEAILKSRAQGRAINFIFFDPFLEGMFNNFDFTNSGIPLASERSFKSFPVPNMLEDEEVVGFINFQLEEFFRSELRNISFSDLVIGRELEAAGVTEADIAAEVSELIRLKRRSGEVKGFPIHLQPGIDNDFLLTIFNSQNATIVSTPVFLTESGSKVPEEFKSAVDSEVSEADIRAARGVRGKPVGLHDKQRYTPPKVLNPRLGLPFVRNAINEYQRAPEPKSELRSVARRSTLDQKKLAFKNLSHPNTVVRRTAADRIASHDSVPLEELIKYLGNPEIPENKWKSLVEKEQAFDAGMARRNARYSVLYILNWWIERKPGFYIPALKTILEQEKSKWSESDKIRLDDLYSKNKSNPLGVEENLSLLQIIKLFRRWHLSMKSKSRAFRLSESERQAFRASQFVHRAVRILEEILRSNHQSPRLGNAFYKRVNLVSLSVEHRAFTSPTISRIARSELRKESGQRADYRQRPSQINRFFDARLDITFKEIDEDLLPVDVKPADLKEAVKISIRETLTKLSSLKPGATIHDRVLGFSLILTKIKDQSNAQGEREVLIEFRVLAKNGQTVVRDKKIISAETLAHFHELSSVIIPEESGKRLNALIAQIAKTRPTVSDLELSQIMERALGIDSIAPSNGLTGYVITGDLFNDPDTRNTLGPALLAIARKTNRPIVAFHFDNIGNSVIQMVNAQLPAHQRIRVAKTRNQIRVQLKEAGVASPFVITSQSNRGTVLEKLLREIGDVRFVNGTKELYNALGIADTVVKAYVSELKLIYSA